MISRSEKWVLTVESFQQRGETCGEGGMWMVRKWKLKRYVSYFKGTAGLDTQALHLESPPLNPIPCGWQSSKARHVLQVPYQSYLHLQSLLATLGLVSSWVLAPTPTVGPGPTLNTCWLSLISPVFTQMSHKDFRSGSPAGSFLSCPLNIRHPTLFLALQPKFPQVKRKRSSGQVIS